jgi:hypothetical protein
MREQGLSCEPKHPHHNCSPLAAIVSQEVTLKTRANLCRMDLQERQG